MGHALAAGLGRLEIPTATGVEYVAIETVVVLHAEGSYTWVCCEGGIRHFVSGNLHKLELQLPGSRFFRCHRSHVINLEKVLRLEREDGYHVVLRGTMRVEVSRRYWPLLRTALRSA